MARYTLVLENTREVSVINPKLGGDDFDYPSDDPIRRLEKCEPFV